MHANIISVKRYCFRFSSGLTFLAYLQGIETPSLRTLMKILYGEYRADKGEILVRGNPVRITNPSVAVALGIGMVHQHFMLVPGLTVLENIILGSEPVKNAVLDTKSARQKIEDIMQKNAMPVDLDAHL